MRCTGKALPIGPLDTSLVLVLVIDSERKRLPCHPRQNLEVDGDRKGGVDSGVCDRLSSSPQAAERDKAWAFSQSL